MSHESFGGKCQAIHHAILCCATLACPTSRGTTCGTITGATDWYYIQQKLKEQAIFYCTINTTHCTTWRNLPMKLDSQQRNICPICWDGGENLIKNSIPKYTSTLKTTWSHPSTHPNRKLCSHRCTPFTMSSVKCEYQSITKSTRKHRLLCCSVRGSILSPLLYFFLRKFTGVCISPRTIERVLLRLPAQFMKTSEHQASTT